MNKPKAAIWTFAFLSVLSIHAVPSGLAQEDIHKGRPLWRMYSTNDTQAAATTHKAMLDQRGFVFAANDAGLLSFDGDSWRIHKTGNERNEIQAIEKLGENVWLTGGPNGIGAFSPNSLGELTWSELFKHTDDENVFDTVLDITTTPDGIFILTDQAVFQFEEDQVRDLAVGLPTGLIFVFDSQTIIETENRVIRKDDEGWTEIIVPPGWDELDLVTVLYREESGPILVTRRSGLFAIEVDDDTLRLNPLWDVLPAPLTTAAVTAAALGSKGAFLLGTENGRFFELQSDGASNLTLDQWSGFRTGRITSIRPLSDGTVMVFFDGGAVWIAVAQSKHL